MSYLMHVNQYDYLFVLCGGYATVYEHWSFKWYTFSRCSHVNQHVLTVVFFNIVQYSLPLSIRERLRTFYVPARPLPIKRESGG